LKVVAPLTLDYPTGLRRFSRLSVIREVLYLDPYVA
jgi:hypothetical protein